MGMQNNCHHRQCSGMCRLCHFDPLQLCRDADGHLRYCRWHWIRHDLLTSYRLCRLLLWEETSVSHWHRCVWFRIRHVRLCSGCCFPSRNLRLERSQFDPFWSHPQLRSKWTHTLHQKVPSILIFFFFFLPLGVCIVYATATNAQEDVQTTAATNGRR